jgi:hypothetical protein
VDLRFESAINFQILDCRTQDGDQLLIPGVIGGPDSERNYARIDSGFSIENLQVPFITTLTTSLVDDSSGFCQPTVYYEVGYSGPLLIPLSSTLQSEISTGMPISHLIPLSVDDVLISIIEKPDPMPCHSDFEGLLGHDWPSGALIISSKSSREIWGLDDATTDPRSDAR